MALYHEENLDDLILKNSEGVPSEDDLIQSLGVPYDPNFQAMSNQLVAARPSEAPPIDASRAPAAASAPVDAHKELLSRYKDASPAMSRMNSGDAIAALLGKRQEQLSSAQDLRNNLQLLAGLGRAGETIGRAFTPLAKTQADDKFYATQMAQADQPVVDVQRQQQMQGQQMKDIATQTELRNNMDKNDPNSEISQLYNKLAHGTIQKAKLGIQLPEGMSAANLEKIMPGIENMANRQLMADSHKVQADYNRELKASRLATDRSDKQNKAESDAYQHVLSFKGNAAAQQASKDVLAADKAIALIDRPGMKTTQDLRLIAEEMGKFASGGVPGEHGTEAIMPSNAKTKMAELMNFIASKPTDAQADAYLKRNKEYLQDAISVSKNVLSKYQLGMAEGYKNRLTPDAYDKLVKTIKSLYESPQDRAPAQSDMVQVRNTKTGQVHAVRKDQVNDALASGGELVQ